uniref:JmjC domain-containing protein n=1 Tax=Globodera rostochiensis TaxID=31243 RepID=A0A914IDC9_GLORO
MDDALDKVFNHLLVMLENRGPDGCCAYRHHGPALTSSDAALLLLQELFSAVFPTPICFNSLLSDLFSVNVFPPGAWAGVTIWSLASTFFMKEFAANSEFLRAKSVLIEPAVLRRNGVRCVRTVQRPGEGVITLPGAVHFGFSTVSPWGRRRAGMLQMLTARLLFLFLLSTFAEGTKMRKLPKQNPNFKDNPQGNKDVNFLMDPYFKDIPQSNKDDSFEQDPYFEDKPQSNEDERFREAEERLQKRYQKKELNDVNVFPPGAWAGVTIWYSVPAADFMRFRSLASTFFMKEFAANSEFLRAKSVLIEPAVLRRNGVRCVRTVHRPGEGVITLPGAVHFGFSTMLQMLTARLLFLFLLSTFAEGTKMRKLPKQNPNFKDNPQGNKDVNFLMDPYFKDIPQSNKDDSFEQDPYFEDKPQSNEDERIREAEERLQKRYQKKELKELSELEELLKRGYCGYPRIGYGNEFRKNETDTNRHGYKRHGFSTVSPWGRRPAGMLQMLTARLLFLFLLSTFAEGTKMCKLPKQNPNFKDNPQGNKDVNFLMDPYFKDIPQSNKDDSFEQDPYFEDKPQSKQDERFREADERLQKRYQKKELKELSELEELLKRKFQSAPLGSDTEAKTCRKIYAKGTHLLDAYFVPFPEKGKSKRFQIFNQWYWKEEIQEYSVILVCQALLSDVTSFCLNSVLSERATGSRTLGRPEHIPDPDTTVDGGYVARHRTVYQ